VASFGLQGDWANRADNTLPKSTRQEGLQLYHFQCKCSRCVGDLDVYQVCSVSPVIHLNKFSLQPDLSKLQNPPIDRSKAPRATAEGIYKAWQSETAVKNNEATAENVRQRWKLCKELVQARMSAMEPIPSVVLQAISLAQADSRTWAYALPLSCFLATECDPYKLVAPFMPWRVKGAMSVAKLLSETARLTASGELANNCPHKALVDILQMSDQVTMCEATLRLVVHHATIGASEDWEVLKEANDMLEEVEGLDGREKESAMLRAWAADPEGSEANAFFRTTVLKPINKLAALAIGILDEHLWDTSGSAIARIAR